MRYKGETKTKCPYYEKESEKSITCQGMYPKTYTASKFTDKKAKEIFQDKECFRYPNNCLLCKYHDIRNNKEETHNSRRITRGSRN